MDEAPEVERPAAPHPTTSVAQLLRLQRTAGNAYVAAIMRQPAPKAEPQAEPEPKKSRAFTANVDIDPALKFETPAAKVGRLTLKLSGLLRTANASAVLIGEELPKPDKKKRDRDTPSEAWHARLRELIAAELAKVALAGSGSRIEATIGGQSLVLELAPGADKAPPFVVGGRFSVQSLAFPTAEITKGKKSQIALDLSVQIEPGPQLVPAGDATPATPAGDASVAAFTFAGVAADFAGADRTAGVRSKAVLDELDAKLPAIVKSHPFFSVPAQRIAFLQEMRTWFGTDEKTIAHFAELKNVGPEVGIKGTAVLHSSAANRLKKVQDEIGLADMPQATGVGWPRSECSFGGEQTIGNLHNLGLAIDYNATETPHLKDRRQLDLISILAGRPAQMDLRLASEKQRDKDQKRDRNPQEAVDRTNRLGDAMMGSGTPEEKAAYLQRPEVKEHLENVLREAREVEAASEKLRLDALKGSKDGKAFDNREAFLELRNQWFDAAKLKPAERKTKQAEIMGKVGDVLGPWTAKVDEHLAATRKRIEDAGYKTDELPDGAQLAAAIAKAKSVWKKLRDAEAALKEKKPAKGAAANAKQAIKQARLLLADLAGPEAALDADAAVLAEVERLAQLADARYGALGSKAWLDRVEVAKQGMLHDPKLIFGSKREKVVGDPGMAQLVDTGFFRTRNNSDYAGAFSPEFVQTMVKYGFTPLASGSEPDSMHFELRRGKPS